MIITRMAGWRSGARRPTVSRWRWSRSSPIASSVLRTSGIAAGWACSCSTSRSRSWRPSCWTPIGRWPRNVCLINFPRFLAALAEFIAQVPEEHQRRDHQIEGVHGPDGSGWQAEDVEGIDRVADVGQNDIAEAVAAEVLGAGRLVQHR